MYFKNGSTFQSQFTSHVDCTNLSASNTGRIIRRERISGVYQIPYFIVQGLPSIFLWIKLLTKLSITVRKGHTIRVGQMGNEQDLAEKKHLKRKKITWDTHV